MNNKLLWYHYEKSYYYMAIVQWKNLDIVNKRLKRYIKGLRKIQLFVVLACKTYYCLCVNHLWSIDKRKSISSRG